MSVNLGHLFVASLTVLEIAAAAAYYHSSDYPRSCLWICYAIANVASLFIGR